MKLNARLRYAMVAMVELARQPSDEPLPLAEIAKRQDISLAYLEQLFCRMRRSSLVISVRGPGGGYRLARPAEKIAISEIVLAVDGPVADSLMAPDAERCSKIDHTRCPTQDLWAALGQQVQDFLSGVSLADVAARRVRPYFDETPGDNPAYA